MILCLLTLFASAEILVDPAPVAGQEITIQVVDDLSQPVAQATVRAIRRPGLPGERDLAVGLTDARGRVYWTPKHGGPQLLRARDHERVVHVAYASPPATTIGLLASAGLLGLFLLLWGLWPSRRR